MIASLLARGMVLGAAIALGGCGLSRPAVEQAAYYLSVPRETAQAQTRKPAAIRVRPLRAAPMYDRKEFLYRIDGERIVADYYNEFAENPDSMITAAVTEWLKRAQLFQAVIEPRLAVDTPYTLEGTIVALYGDFRDANKPAAVLGIQFYLVRTNSNGREVLLDRTLQERVDIPARTAQALVQGYNEALSRILEQLERELAALDLGRAAVTQR